MVKYGQKTLIVKKFKWEELGLKKLRKNSSSKTIVTNSDNFAQWIINQLTLIEPEKGDKKYSSMGIYMNQMNVDKLKDYLDSFIWLQLSPVTCNDLQDNEFGIDLTNVLDNE